MISPVDYFENSCTQSQCQTVGYTRDKKPINCCILFGFFTPSFRSCENIGQSDNSKIAQIGFKNYMHALRMHAP